MTRAVWASAVLLGILAAGGVVSFAAQSSEEVVLAQFNFDPAEKQWTMRDDGKTRSFIRYRDGILKFFPGPGTDSKGRSNWHGKTLSRALRIYGDFTIELQMAWEIKGQLRGGCRAFIEPRSGRVVPLYVIFHLDNRGIEAKDSSQCVGYMGGLAEAGRGTLRFERRGQLLRVLWEGKQIAEIADDTPETVDAFAVQFKNLPQAMQESWVGLTGFTVSVPKPDIQLADQPIPGREGVEEKTIALARGLQAMLQDLSERTYRRETTLDVLGFNLAAIQGRKEFDDLTKRVTAWSDKSGGIRQLRDDVDKISRRAAAIAQFYDRVAPEDVVRLETQVAEVKEATAKALEPLDAEEQALRKELAALKAPKPRAWKDNFDWARNNFHIYWFNHYGNVPPGHEDSLRYMNEMGATSLQEWGYRGERQGTWEEYVAEWRRKLDLMGKENLRMFITPPGAFVGHPHPDYRVATAETIAKHMQAFADHPAFAGFEFDEIHFGNCWCRICMPLFHEYLKKRFSHEELVGLGVIEIKDDAAQEKELLDQQIETILNETPAAGSPTHMKEKVKGKAGKIDQIGGPSPGERSANPVLYTVRMEWRAQVFEEAAREAIARVHELKPDALIHVLLSPANFADYTNRDWGGPFGAPLYRMAAIADIITIDPYWNGVPEEAYWCDLMRAHAKGPTLLTVGTHYDARTPDSLERDLCIPFAHADGMYIFDWVYCFKQPPYRDPAWTEFWLPTGKWDRVWSVAMKAKKMEPYLVGTESLRTLAMLHSMRSQALEQHKGDLAGADPGNAALASPRIYNMRQMGLYSLFRQARVQVDPVYAEGLSAEQLGRYRVLYIQNAVSMTPDEEEMIRSWVRNGGQLIATASTTTMDRWGRERKDYGLADVFGVNYAGRKTLDKVKLAAQPGMTYSGAFDKVRPASGKAVLAWPDGSPAVVENQFGKGRCVFVTARDLGLNYTGEKAGPERPCFNVYKTYSTGVVEFVRGLVTRELAAVNQPLPYVAQNVPGEVEIAVRVQPEHQRRIVHLLNYGYHTPIKGVTIAIPAGNKVKAFYAADDRPVEFRRKANTIEFTVRDFDVHEAIVVEEPRQ